MGMSNDKINRVLDIYEKKVKEALDQIAPPTCDTDQVFWDKMSHLGEMIPKMRGFLKEGRREKTFRWLGFMQGVLYACGIYTIKQMADHNRPTKSEMRKDSPGHSFGRHVTCSACGDLDGCHLWNDYLEAPE